MRDLWLARLLLRTKILLRAKNFHVRLILLLNGHAHLDVSHKGVTMGSFVKLNLLIDVAHGDWNWFAQLRYSFVSLLQLALDSSNC
jgi:hypothetical protein